MAVKKQETPKQEITKESAVQFTDEQMQKIREMIAEAVADATAAAPKEPARRENETVTILYLAEVARDCKVEVDGFGQITPGGYWEIPKTDFGSRFMTELVRKLIAKREFIVLNGLDETERSRWNCNYRDGEILDHRAFDRILDMNADDLRTVCAKLCPEHKKMIVRRMITGCDANDQRVTLEKARAIKDACTKEEIGEMLRPVLDKLADEIRN